MRTVKLFAVLGLVAICSCGGGDGITGPDTTKVTPKPSFSTQSAETAYANQTISMPYNASAGSVEACSSLPAGWLVNASNGVIHLTAGNVVDDSSVQPDGRVIQSVCLHVVDHGVASDPVFAQVEVLKPVVNQTVLQGCTHPDTGYEIHDNVAFTFEVSCPRDPISVQDSPQGKWLGTKWMFGLFNFLFGSSFIDPNTIQISGAAGGGPTRTIGIRVVNIRTASNDGGEMCFDVKLITSLPPDPTYPYDDSCAGIAKAEKASKSIGAADNVSLFNSMKSFNAERALYHGSSVWVRH